MWGQTTGDLLSLTYWSGPVVFMSTVRTSQGIPNAQPVQSHNTCRDLGYDSVRFLEPKLFPRVLLAPLLTCSLVEFFFAFHFTVSCSCSDAFVHDCGCSLGLLFTVGGWEVCGLCRVERAFFRCPEHVTPEVPTVSVWLCAIVSSRTEQLHHLFLPKRKEVHTCYGLNDDLSSWPKKTDFHLFTDLFPFFACFFQEGPRQVRRPTTRRAWSMACGHPTHPCLMIWVIVLLLPRASSVR